MPGPQVKQHNPPPLLGATKQQNRTDRSNAGPRAAHSSTGEGSAWADAPQVWSEEPDGWTGLLRAWWDGRLGMMFSQEH